MQDQVPHYDQNDPVQRAAADRRWAKMTAAGGSIVLLGLFNFLAELFTASSNKVVHAQQTLRSGDPLNVDRDDGSQNPYGGRVTLTPRSTEQTDP